MIIGEINDIRIDSSMLDLVNLACLHNKCAHHGCCYETVKITEEEKKKITEALPKIAFPITQLETLKLFKFYRHDNTIRTISKQGDAWSTCIFLNNGKCLLETQNVSPQPLQCKAFPVVLEHNNLRLSYLCNITCIEKGTQPAYKVLKDEIIMLTSEVFYNKLLILIEEHNKKLLFYNREN